MQYTNDFKNIKEMIDEYKSWGWFDSLTDTEMIEIIKTAYSMGYDDGKSRREPQVVELEESERD